MQTTLVVTMGDTQLSAKHISVQEMRNVKIWTGIAKRDEWFAAILQQDPDALIAAYVVARRRQEDGASVSFSDGDFDLDQLRVKLVDDTGREVEPMVDRNKDDSVKLNDKGEPIPLLDRKGTQRWRYSDTGDEVPPTKPGATTT